MNPQQPNYAPNVVNQTVQFGGATWKGNPGQGWTLQSSTPGASGATSAPGFNDVVNNAQQLQNFQVQANQPAIQNLQQQSTDLQSRYSDLINSIKGQGSVAVNQQTLAANNELGARGILPSSSLYQQQLASSLLPVTQANQSQLAQTGLGEQQDLNTLAGQIASLQAGNPLAAISGATNYAQLAQQAAQFQQSQAQNLALQGSQLALQGLTAGYIPVSPGASLFNTKTGASVGGNTPQLSPLSSSGGGNTYQYKVTGNSSQNNTQNPAPLTTNLQKAAGVVSNSVNTNPNQVTGGAYIPQNIVNSQNQNNLLNGISGLNVNLGGYGNQLTTGNKQTNPNSFLGLSF